MDGGSEGSSMVDNCARPTGKDVRTGSRCRRELMATNKVPDDVLLEIFGFYVIEEFYLYDKQRIENWQTLAHVCRRWRSLVFQSPRCLNLRLICSTKTRAKDLDIWPSFPLIICDDDSFDDERPIVHLDNIINALEHNGRVCQIKLVCFTSQDLEYIRNSPEMQEPFPELTDLHLSTYEGFFVDFGPGHILPDSFLGGTAPRLRSLKLDWVPFPGLPKLLSSATHLVELDLYDIPDSGHIPPEAMATALSALNSLEFLYLHFLLPQPRPALEGRRPPPRPPSLTRSILPSLTQIIFQGASEYLEEILAEIDTPRLDKMFLGFFDQILFDTAQPFQFTSRSPTMRAQQRGYIEFDFATIMVRLSSSDYFNFYDVLTLKIPYTALKRQLSSIKQVCNSSLPSVSVLKDLYILVDPFSKPYWQDDDENTLWLELLRPFAAVKNLYISEEFVPHIASALQELVEGRTTEVLPTLENIFLQGYRPTGHLEAIEKFVAARRLTSRPVAVSRWYGMWSVL